MRRPGSVWKSWLSTSNLSATPEVLRNTGKVSLCVCETQPSIQSLFLPIACVGHLTRCGPEQHGTEHLESTHAEEAGDPGSLSASGGGRPSTSHESCPLFGGANRHRAHFAAPEPAAALIQLVGCCPCTRMSVPRPRLVN